MQNSGSFRLLNLQPKMLISYKDLQAIKYIVDIAPQEAQWFHRVQKIVEGTDVYYRIYEMYIPEQICSSVQVESDPMMMVNFYKELKGKYGQEKTNDIMSNLTAWCHSHVNMGVSPSGQDVKQFAEQCKNAMDSNVDTPQVMMIFNKKDLFYCKVFDPEYGLVFEHVPLEIESSDFSWILNESKEKFKKPVVKTFPTQSYTNPTKTYKEWSWGPNDDFEYETTKLSEFVDDNVISIENQKPFDLFTKHYRKNSSNKNLKRFLKINVDAQYMKILNDAITYDKEIITSLLKTYLDIPKSLDTIYNEFFDNLETENLDKEKIEAAVVFTSLFYEELATAKDIETLDEIVNGFIEAFSKDSLGNQSLLSTYNPWRT